MAAEDGGGRGAVPRPTAHAANKLTNATSRIPRRCDSERVALGPAEPLGERRWTLPDGSEIVAHLTIRRPVR